MTTAERALLLAVAAVVMHSNPHLQQLIAAVAADPAVKPRASSKTKPAKRSPRAHK